MAWIRPFLRLIFAISVVAVGLSLGGCTLLNDINDVLYPTATPAGLPATPTPAVSTPGETAMAPPVDTPTLAPTFTLPAPTQTSAPTVAPPTSTPGPKPDEELALVYARGGSVYRGGYWGADGVEVAVAQLDEWDFSRGLLAMARGGALYVINLAAGTLNEWRPILSGPVEYATLRWGAQGRYLLYAAVVQDAAASTSGRTADVQAIDPTTGQLLGRALLRDVSGIQLLRYDEAARQAVVIARRDSSALETVSTYDLASGTEVRSLPIQGQEAVPSPQGQWLLTQTLPGDKQPASLRVYDLSTAGQASPRVWTHPENTHSASHVWSPDGSAVAYLLRDGSTYEAATEGRGLWMLDLATLQAKQVLEEGAISSSLVGWTPDGAYIVGFHRGGVDDSYFFAVRPDGGDRRILPLDPEAEILGWMPPVDTRTVPKVALDPWPARFADAGENAEAVANVVAELLAARVHTPEGELSEQITQYLHEAGWQVDYRGATVRSAGDGLFVAQLPPFGIYAMTDGQAQQVASGNVLIDVRREGQELGIIFGILDDQGVQPAFMLYRAGADGAWAPVWSPQGQRDWVATDGEIVFAGEGLSALRVAGTSFGLEYGEHRVFVECEECPHRRLVATWIKQDAAYTRQTSLPADASMHEVYWEMTQPTPYAIVFEALWRLRHGLSADELIASSEVMQQLEQYGLLSPDLLLVPEEEMVNGVRFADIEGTRRFYALTKDDRLLHIQPAP